MSREILSLAELGGRRGTLDDPERSTIICMYIIDPGQK